MRPLYLSLCFLGSTLGSRAQNLPPAGGGSYHPPVAECVSPDQRRQIEAMLATNIAQLQQRGVLPPARPAQPLAVPLNWPLRQAPGYDYTNLYGISNFVDHNPAFPNAVQDFNCGTRTYDTSGGYNHAGTDFFLWPFSYIMMDRGQAEIVAAAPGVIVGRVDGNFDRNCAISNASWNAVYVQNADGTVCWYGHMKSGSVTAKAVGATVALGEKLGLVGSSGSSTAPHLHFELRSASGEVLDPYSGPCSPAASAWATPRTYFESAINTLLTHSAAPVFPSCPNPEIPNESSAFTPGSTLITGAYYHDQRAGQPTLYTIYRPDNSVFTSWTHMSSAAHYAASYWYWSHALPANAPSGSWRFEAQYQGLTTSRAFTVGVVSATATAQPALYALYPNPATDAVRLTGPLPIARVQVLNPLGQVVRTFLHLAQPTLNLTDLGEPGLYLVRIFRVNGTVEQHKLMLE